MLLIAVGTNNFKTVTNYEECEARFNLGLGWMIAIQGLRCVVDYASVALVFYFTFWKHRKLVHSDSKSSIDIMFNSSSEGA